MTQAKLSLVTFDEFIAWYPENSECHYELHKGIIVEMPKLKGQHSQIAGFLCLELGLQCKANKFSCLIPKESVVKPFREESGYEPDVIVLNRLAIAKEPRWAAESIITMGESIRLIVEVVSTNWRDDYLTKLADYVGRSPSPWVQMGIPEYWIVDYLGLGGRAFIGKPKQPTLSI